MPASDITIGPTARDVKDAIYGRHPSVGVNGGPGAWTVLEEVFGLDALAIGAWSSTGNARVGYEVKVSRSDYRRELLRPHKRSAGVRLCNEFYFAVPAGLLKPDELAYEESLWDDGDFERERCPDGCVKASTLVGRRRRRGSAPSTVPGGYLAPKPVPVPTVLTVPGGWWQRHRDRYTPEQLARFEREDLGLALAQAGWTFAPCPTCDGKGYVKGSRVEREAPTLWVPRDVGLIEVDGRGCTVTRKAPRREVPPLAPYALGQLVRWASFRPDRRHRSTNDHHQRGGP